MSERIDVHAKVTAQIVAAIEAGAGQFSLPWHSQGGALSRPFNVLRRAIFTAAAAADKAARFLTEKMH